MPVYTSGPKRGERMKSYDQAKALRGFTPTKKKSPTGSAAVGGAS